MSYNVFSGSSRGPDIFGTEPWHFYIRNLLLNFNIWFLLALCAGPLILLQLLFRRPSSNKLSLARTLVFATPLYLWLAIFSMQAHKEERFMYPAYPFLCLNAAVTLHIALYYLGHSKHSLLVGYVPDRIKVIAVTALVLVTIILGLLRTIGTVTAYEAPLQLYNILKSPEYENMGGSVCLGKEWYRFPSSYFLSSKMRARFIKSDFSGLLPGQFSESKGSFGLPATWHMPSGMNNQNVEDFGKYVRLYTNVYYLSQNADDLGRH